MCIYFRCQDGLMPQHLLHRPQISPPVNQFSSKGMPECMGTDILLDAGSGGEFLDHGKDHDP